MRKLASVRVVSALDPIEKADAIEVATIDGWRAVVKKGEFKVGEHVVYLECDSWVPHSLAPFLSKGKEPRVYQGIAGERLKTVKLRGQLSQGLILPITILQEGLIDTVVEGDDVSDHLGIVKWEKELPASMRGSVRGNFPTEVPKTDQERVQNLKSEIALLASSGFNETFEVTEKLDGTSCTFYLDSEGVFHVCSRNLDLKEEEGNLYWKVARQIGIEEKMREFALDGCAIQGEIIGEGVQGNQYGMTGQHFFVFDVYVVSRAEYMSPISRRTLTEAMQLNHVPVITDNAVIDESTTVDSILQDAVFKSTINGSEAEGKVWKSNNTYFTFKAISNNWLLDNE